MKTDLSAGLLMYRFNNGQLEVLLAHPGGPLYCDKDDRYWGIPKGHVEEQESIIEGAFREFREETGVAPYVTDMLYLGCTRGNYSRIIHIWAFEGNCDTSLPVQSNLFTMEWPPHSGQEGVFPEVDRLCFFNLTESKKKIEYNQQIFLVRLQGILTKNKPQPVWYQKCC